MNRGLAAAWALAGAAASAQAGCPLDGPSLRGDGPLQLAWQADRRPIAAQRPFALAIRLCPDDARLLRVDATMPEHGHGMNYAASLLPLGKGRWRAEGLLWHMSGRWELSFEVEAGGRTQHLRQSVMLK